MLLPWLVAMPRIILSTVPATRDPISIKFDPAAAKLLRSAIAANGGWAGTFLAQPSLQWWAWAQQQGIDLYGYDRWGMDRWTRAFKRSVYYQFKWHYYETRGLVLAERRVSPARSQAIIWESGRLSTRGRAVRIRTAAGGKAAYRAAERKPSKSYVADESFRSTVADRDWV
jgi:hypothetical protein